MDEIMEFINSKLVDLKSDLGVIQSGFDEQDMNAEYYVTEHIQSLEAIKKMLKPN